MRFIMKSIVALLVLAGILAAASFALPREIEVARAIEINAPPEKIFPYVNDFRKFGEWSPWAKIDPKTTYTYAGPDSGKGAKVTWSSTHSEVGSGSQTIVRSIENKRVVTALDFGQQGTAKAAFTLKPNANGTRVRWGFSTDAGNNPIMRWMGLMMDRWIGEKYEEGLQNLKRQVETG